MRSHRNSIHIKFGYARDDTQEDELLHHEMHDDFMNLSNEDGEIGNLGWEISSGQFGVITSQLNHPGIIGITTNASAPNTVARMTISRYIPTSIRLLRGVVQPSGVTSASYRFGILANPESNVESSVGMYFSFRSTLASTWRAVTRDTSSITVTTLETPASNVTWYQLDIQQQISNIIEFYVNGRLSATHTTNIPVSACTIGFMSESHDNGQPSLSVDFFESRLIPIGSRF